MQTLKHGRKNLLFFFLLNKYIRTEERCVGEEGRSWGVPADYKKKKKHTDKGWCE